MDVRDTYGQWERSGHNQIVTKGPRGGMVLVCTVNSAYTVDATVVEARLHLIQAAPELLAACKGLMSARTAEDRLSAMVAMERAIRDAEKGAESRGRKL